MSNLIFEPIYVSSLCGKVRHYAEKTGRVMVYRVRGGKGSIHEDKLGGVITCPNRIDPNGAFWIEAGAFYDNSHHNHKHYDGFIGKNVYIIKTSIRTSDFHIETRDSLLIESCTISRSGKDNFIAIRTNGVIYKSGLYGKTTIMMESTRLDMAHSKLFSSVLRAVSKEKHTLYILSCIFRDSTLRLLNNRGALLGVETIFHFLRSRFILSFIDLYESEYVSGLTSVYKTDDIVVSEAYITENNMNDIGRPLYVMRDDGIHTKDTVIAYWTKDLQWVFAALKRKTSRTESEYPYTAVIGTMEKDKTKDAVRIKLMNELREQIKMHERYRPKLTD